jgi:uncharacterized membrane protein YcaP (DUF421 family)
MDIQDLWSAMIGVGEEAKDLDALQVALRTIIVYAVTLTIVRLGKKRFMGRGTAFDVIVGIIVGSIASRTITGNAPLGPAVAGIAALLALHWIFSAAALHWHGFGVAVKGRSRLIIRDGVLDEKALRAAHLTQRDLEEDLREKGCRKIDVAQAYLERDGNLSVRVHRPEPRIVEVDVASGVQRVRIEIG